MTARRGYPAVDRFRVAAALLVVCIHTAPLASFSAAADFALKTLARLAVPFFFTATGFFLLGELVRPGLRPRTLSPGVRRFLKKTGVLYAACTVLYLPVTLYAGNFPVKNVLGELVRDAVLDGTFYHLWYLPAALLGVLVVCGLLRFLRPGAAELLHSQFTTLQDSAALPHYDLAFITNPTSLHAQALEEIRGLADALFIEKPIVSAEQTDVDLATLLPAGQKAYVAAPMRWCGTMLALKNHLPGLRPYSARVICSSYLPDWRPGVDYRTVYSAHKALGGGVTIDLIHEWDYLVDLFGVPETICNIRGKYSDLEIDSDDLSIYIAQYPTLLAEVHLDYFGRTYRRSIELFCKDGSCVADFGAGTLTLPNGAVEHYEEDVNRRYEREMEYFVDYALTGSGESCNPPALALNVLKLTLGENVQ